MSDNTDLPQDQGLPGGQPPGLKYLEWAVYSMGALLVLMLIGLLGGVAWKIAHRGEVPLVPVQLFDLGLAAGETVSATALDGDRLMVTTDRGIILVDLRRNAVAARIVFRAP